MANFIDFNFDDPPEIRQKAIVSAQEGGPNSGFEIEGIDFFKDGTAANTFPEMKEDIDLIVSTENYVNRLIDLHTRVKQAKGMSRSFAVEFNELIPDMQAFSPNRFTEEITLTGWQPSLEALSAKIWALIVAGAIALIALIVKFFKWLFGSDSSSAGGSNVASSTRKTHKAVGEHIGGVKTIQDVNNIEGMAEAFSKTTADVVSFGATVTDETRDMISDLRTLDVDVPVPAIFWEIKEFHKDDSRNIDSATIREHIRRVVSSQAAPKNDELTVFSTTADNLVFGGVSVLGALVKSPDFRLLAPIVSDLMGKGEVLKKVDQSFSTLEPLVHYYVLNSQQGQALFDEINGNVPTQDQVVRLISLIGNMKENGALLETKMAGGFLALRQELDDATEKAVTKTPIDKFSIDMVEFIDLVRKNYPNRAAEKWQRHSASLITAMARTKFVLENLKTVADAIRSTPDLMIKTDSIAPDLNKLIGAISRDAGGVAKLTEFYTMYFSAWAGLGEFIASSGTATFKIYRDLYKKAGLEFPKELDSIFIRYQERVNQESQKAISKNILEVLKKASEKTSSGIKTVVRFGDAGK